MRFLYSYSWFWNSKGRDSVLGCTCQTGGASEAGRLILQQREWFSCSFGVMVLDGLAEKKGLGLWNLCWITRISIGLRCLMTLLMILERYLLCCSAHWRNRFRVFGCCLFLEGPAANLGPQLLQKHFRILAWDALHLPVILWLGFYHLLYS